MAFYNRGGRFRNNGGFRAGHRGGSAGAGRGWQNNHRQNADYNAYAPFQASPTPYGVQQQVAVDQPGSHWDNAASFKDAFSDDAHENFTHQERLLKLLGSGVKPVATTEGTATEPEELKSEEEVQAGQAEAVDTAKLAAAHAELPADEAPEPSTDVEIPTSEDVTAPPLEAPESQSSTPAEATTSVRRTLWQPCETKTRSNKSVDWSQLSKRQPRDDVTEGHSSSQEPTVTRVEASLPAELSLNDAVESEGAQPLTSGAKVSQAAAAEEQASASISAQDKSPNSISGAPSQHPSEEGQAEQTSSTSHGPLNDQRSHGVADSAGGDEMRDAIMTNDEETPADVAEAQQPATYGAPSGEVTAQATSDDARNHQQAPEVAYDEDHGETDPTQDRTAMQSDWRQWKKGEITSWADEGAPCDEWETATSRWQNVARGSRNRRGGFLPKRRVTPGEKTAQDRIEEWNEYTLEQTNGPDDYPTSPHRRRNPDEIAYGDGLQHIKFTGRGLRDQTAELKHEGDARLRDMARTRRYYDYSPPFTHVDDQGQYHEHYVPQGQMRGGKARGNRSRGNAFKRGGYNAQDARVPPYGPQDARYAGDRQSSYEGTSSEHQEGAPGRRGNPAHRGAYNAARGALPGSASRQPSEFTSDTMHSQNAARNYNRAHYRQPPDLLTGDPLFTPARRDSHSQAQSAISGQVEEARKWSHNVMATNYLFEFARLVKDAQDDLDHKDFNFLCDNLDVKGVLHRGVASGMGSEDVQERAIAKISEGQLMLKKMQKRSGKR